MTPCDIAIEILRLTNDGEDLAPKHLALVELACNGNLSLAGETAFAELHQSVLAGYKKPWHCDIEHVTKDLQGFVFWRGIKLEHFSFRTHEAEVQATQRLGEICLILEARALEITFSNYFKIHEETIAA